MACNKDREYPQGNTMATAQNSICEPSSSVSESSTALNRPEQLQMVLSSLIRNSKSSTQESRPGSGSGASRSPGSFTQRSAGSVAQNPVGTAAMGTVAIAPGSSSVTKGSSSVAERSSSGSQGSSSVTQSSGSVVKGSNSLTQGNSSSMGRSSSAIPGPSSSGQEQSSLLQGPSPRQLSLGPMSLTQSSSLQNTTGSFAESQVTDSATTMPYITTFSVTEDLDSTTPDLNSVVRAVTPVMFNNRGSDGWQLSKSFMERHEYMYETKMTADVCFHVGCPETDAEDIWAHRYMLVANSPVFEAMFDPAWSSSGSLTTPDNADAEKIDIPDIIPAAFHEMLRYIYYEEAKIDGQNAFGVLYASKKYQLPALVTLCKDFITKHIKTDTVCLFLDQSLDCAEDDITESCIRYIASHAVKVLKSSGLSCLSRKALLQIIKTDGLKVDSEKQVFDACMKWALEKCQAEGVTPTQKGLRTVLGEVLYAIRFPCIEKEHLLSITQKTDILSKDEKIEIYESILGTDGQTGKFLKQPRKFRKETVAIQITRYKTVTRGFWLAHEAKTTHAISFSLNQNASISGIGMFKCASAKPVTTTIEILDSKQVLMARMTNENLTINDYNRKSQEYEFIISGLHFNEAVPLRHDQPYTIVAKETYQGRTDDIPATIGMNGLAVVTASGLTVNFVDAKAVPNNGTKVQSGQIPHLLFKVTKK